MSAGLTADSAAALFARAERHLAVAAPPPALTQSHLHHYLRAAAAAGIPAAPHPPPLPHASAANASIWPNVVTADSAGRRRDAAAAYLAPALAGPCAHNLRVVQPAAVRRIVFERGRATAVEYLLMDAQGGPQPRRAAAGAEVILSAGPYGSPQLLQLSGIGPGGVLRMHGIAVERELPVGLNSIVRSVLYAARSPDLCMCYSADNAISRASGRAPKRAHTRVPSLLHRSGKRALPLFPCLHQAHACCACCVRRGLYMHT